MRILTVAAFAAAIALASPVAAQADYAEREAAARILFAPDMAGVVATMIGDLRQNFQSGAFSTTERAELARALDAEVPALTQGFEDALVRTAARHVPLEQIREGADFGSPEWTAASAEFSAWSEGTAADFVSRVAERVCVVDTPPSAYCSLMLEKILTFKTGTASE